MQIKSIQQINENIEKNTKEFLPNSRKPKRFDVVIRKPHFYDNQIEQYILKHLSSELFTHLKKRRQTRGLIEVEILQIFSERDDKTISLVIGINPWIWTMNSKLLQEDISYVFNNFITDVHQLTRSKNKKMRRFGETLRRASQNGNIGLIEYLEHFKNTENLELEQIQIFPTQWFNPKEGVTYFVRPKMGRAERINTHAEEHLLEIIDIMRRTNTIDWKFRIHGRRRPCMTCGLRLQRSVVHYYNRYFGLLYNNTLPICSNDNEGISGREGDIRTTLHMDVLRYVLTKPSYVTRARKSQSVVPSVASETETDDDNRRAEQ